MLVRPLSLERGTGSSALPQLAAGVPADEAEVRDALGDGFELGRLDLAVHRELGDARVAPEDGNGPSTRLSSSTK